jgi:hypothetical protein
LVDGYDEISASDRGRVDKAVRLFATLDVGNFYITCRSNYSIDDLDARHLAVAPFTHEDSTEYVEAFASAYGIELDAKTFVAELVRRRFEDFLRHPLMLALVCILRGGSMPKLPRNTIGLIRRAIETLTARWDESKRIARRTTLPLDGEDRMRCLMYVAFRMRKLVESEDVVLRATNEYLRLAQWESVDAMALLRELAQWYGILVPAGGDEWTFAHRTVHDFLAARYWVENGLFDPQKVTIWDSRAAYATCLRQNATDALSRALATARDIFVLIECLNNNAAFDPKLVAHAVAEHFSRFPETWSYRRDSGLLYLATEDDFFELASDEFLKNLALVGGDGQGAGHDLTFAYALSELRRRRTSISPSIRQLIARRVSDGISAIEITRFGQSIRIVLGERDDEP